MNVLEVLAETICDLLRADPQRVVLGEDVAEGTMLGLTRAAAQDQTLRTRLISRPLAPASLAAHAAGMAAGGLRPIVVLPSAGALLESLLGLREAGQVQWRSGGERAAPVLFVAPCGPGFGLGGDATEGLESTIARVPGVRTLVLSDPDSAQRVFRAAADFWSGDEPTVLLIPRFLALHEANPTEGDLERPFARPYRVREGTAATVFAWGACVALATRAAEHSGADVCVVDVECLSPLSTDVLVDEARATGKLVIVHAGPRAFGIGAELAALFADEAILYLDAPVLRVCGAQSQLRPDNEFSALPPIADVVSAIQTVVNY